MSHCGVHKCLPHDPSIISPRGLPGRTRPDFRAWIPSLLHGSKQFLTAHSERSTWPATPRVDQPAIFIPMIRPLSNALNCEKCLLARLPGMFRLPKSSYNRRKPFSAITAYLWHKDSIWMIFYVEELLDDWNVDVPGWKYPMNLESPRVSSPGFDNDSKMMVINRRSKASDLPGQLSSATGTTVSRQTMYRRLGNIGLFARRPVRCVPLTTTHWRLRLTWSREHAVWTPQQWSCVMFSDESRFCLQSDSRRTLIWRAPGTRYHQENKHH
ncbi:transposable element Tcb1 transposase [Trichonephila clavipes]|uniref:Transposable element Tcb1 transposase n=1 Tax=Trichonephila clavipes TaxID=2585209 RepID=A0A8X7BA35_TRICX|nr:transposable element Tcb1 transposase [Trichonephila clavipes]